MIWRLVGYSLAGLAFYLLFLTTTVPAAWLGEALARTTQGVLTLGATQGTIWRGSGILELRGRSTTLNSRVRWQLLGGPLFTGKLGIALEGQGDLDIKSTLELGTGSLMLRETEWEMPASQMQAFYAPAAFLSPTGRLRGAIKEFVIDSGTVRGEAQVRWLEAGSKLGAFNDLGDYLLVVAGENDSVTLRLETLRGDLKLSAQGRWQIGGDGPVSLQGSLNPGARDTALKPLITLLQARREGNEYRLAGAGHLLLPAWLAAKQP